MRPVNISTGDGLRNSKVEAVVYMPMPTPSWISQHHNISYIMSTYLQLFFNVVVFGFIVYVISSGLVTFWRDVDMILHQDSIELLADISQCTQLYLQNDCRPDIRPPALHDDCVKWEKCMDRNTDAIGRSKVTAQLVAEIVNSFMEPFSYKSMIVGTVMVLMSLFVSNVAFGFWRAKAYFNNPNNNNHHNSRNDFLTTGPNQPSLNY